MQIFHFRDGHVTTFRHTSGAYIYQMSGHRLSRLAKASLGFPPVALVWGKTANCAWTGESYHKTRKCCFFGSGSANATNSGIFTIAPVLTSTLTVCRRNRGDPSLQDLGCFTSFQKYSRYGLAWRRPRADRGLSRPTSVGYSVQQ